MMDKGLEDKVLGIIKEIQTISGSPPCKKTVQKLVYLIQEAGNNLGITYSIHYYGPYSEVLDYGIRDLGTYGIVDVKITSQKHTLSVNESVKTSPIDPIAKRVISVFGRETPSQLELLATTLYVQRELETVQEEKIINCVKKIKGTKYPLEEIEKSINELKEHGYF